MRNFNIQDCILFEDKEILVCHKPAGIAVQNARLGAADMESSLKACECFPLRCSLKFHLLSCYRMTKKRKCV